MENTGAHNTRRINDMVQKFLEDLTSRRYSPRTVETYRCALHDFGLFLEEKGIEDIRVVTAKQVEEYRLKMRERNLQPATVETYLHGLIRFFSHLTERQELFENPAKLIGPVIHTQKLQPVPTEEDMVKVLAAPDVGTWAGLRAKAILEFMYSTGIRLEELAKVKVADLDMEHGTVLIRGKGARERVVPVGKEALHWVKRYIVEVRGTMQGMETETRLWMGRYRNTLDSEGLSVIIRNETRKAGTAFRILPHMIRRACATHMLRHGASPTFADSKTVA